MKSNKLILSILLIPFFSFSQTTKSVKIFLDSTWNESTETNYKYYRIIKDFYTEKENYTVSDYYKSGSLQMTGTSKVKDQLLKEGQFVYYYENGKKESVTNYNMSRPYGREFNWYESGLPKSEIEYIESQNNDPYSYKIIQFWNSENIQKVIDGFGEYETQTDHFYETGKIVNGLKHGEWTGNLKSLKLSFKENYNNGILTSGVTTDSQNNKYPYKTKSSNPGPKNGLKHFYHYFSSNFRTPNEL